MRLLLVLIPLACVATFGRVLHFHSCRLSIGGQKLAGGPADLRNELTAQRQIRALLDGVVLDDFRIATPGFSNAGITPAPGVKDVQAASTSTNAGRLIASPIADYSP